MWARIGKAKAYSCWQTLKYSRLASRPSLSTRVIIKDLLDAGELFLLQDSKKDSLLFRFLRTSLSFKSAYLLNLLNSLC